MSFPNASALNTVQASSEEIVIPVSDDSGSKTPRLSIKDCAAYGSEYGYPECAGIPSTKPKRKFRPRAKKPDFPLAPYFQQYRSQKRVTPVPNQKAPPRSAEAKPNPYTDNTPRPKKRKPPRLSLQQLTKIAGELLIVTFDGQFTPEAGLKSIRDVLRSGAAGGVLIRNRNITSPFQLQALTSLLRDASKTPLLIAIERPGAGIEYPSKPGFKMFPTPREMARKKDPHAAFNAYQDMAKELLSVGVNMNIGPNANVCPENASRRYDRCFSSDPRHAAAFANAFNFAHADRKILTAMRFKTSSAEETSLEMMRVMTDSRGPDALVIDINDAEYIRENMIFGAEDSLWKAGFDGAIIFDISERSKKQSVSNALVSALESGGDLVLVSTPRERQADLAVSAANALRWAINGGQISEDRILNAYKYAQRLKTSLKASKGYRSRHNPDFTSSTGRN